MLEQLAWQVASNQQNIHVLHTLLNDLKKIVNNYYCWGRPIGSTALWQNHLETLEKICQKAASIEIKEVFTPFIVIIFIHFYTSISSTLAK